MHERHSFIAKFQTRDSAFAQKALDYLDGLQLERVVELLDDPQAGRREWKEKGMRPTYRNLTE